MSNVRLDSIGWTYISLIIVWSVLIVTGMTYLWINRNIPSLRMRRIPLLFAGIIPLHLYAIVCLLAYSIGPLVPCTAEFWVMSLYLPLGIALFHATNSQFFHLASRQKQFAHMSRLQDAKSMDEERTRQAASSRWKKFFVGDEKADNIERTLVFIGVGIAIQVSMVLSVPWCALIDISSRSLSLCLSSLAQRSSTLVGASSTTLCKERQWKCA